MRSALQADAKARGLIEGGQSPAEAIAGLRAAEGELGAAARGWLDLVSYRLQNGLDVCELTNIETPALLVTTIRRALASRSPRQLHRFPSPALGARWSISRVRIFASSDGDGLKAANEQCDDGNNVDGDGCSHDCHIEIVIDRT